VKNPDILEELGRMAGPRPVVGFALETGNEDQALTAARAKLEAKRCSMVVLNRPGSFGGPQTEAVTLVSRDEAVVLGHPSKRSLGERIVRYLEERIDERGNT
jgi:phosphopantothenoylcysteine synthetase/decarboxylase